MRSRFAFVIAALGYLVLSVRPGDIDFKSRGAWPSSGAHGRGERDRLTASDLLAGRFPGIVSNDYFLPVGAAESASHSFTGLVVFSETEMFSTRPDSDWSGSGQRWFPAISLPVVRREGVLLPLERGIIYSGGRGRSFWNFIASPGRVWREPGDKGWSRASFPFTLTDNFVGQALNGLATFLFTSSGISQVAIQITQETSPKIDYIRGDFHASVPARFVPQEFAETGPAVDEFEREMSARPPVLSWSVLSDAGFTRSFFNADLPAESVSLAALMIRGTLYLQPAETRSGPYPYPLEMRHGVFSVTKTLVVGLSMLYFAERYGEEIFDARITDYVPELAGHAGWRGVTFGHALDMATGTQGNDRDINFIRARTAAEKLAVVVGMPDAPYAPGERFLYSSSNTFTLACALARYVQSREGPMADFWLLVRENVLRPIGAGAMPTVRTLEPEGASGIPVGGWGCYPTVLEAVQIGRLISDEGIHDGRQILNRNKTREALERTSRRGLATGQAATRYLHSFWIGDFALSTGPITVPHMSGHGGSFVVVFPGAAIAIRFADEDNREIAPMIAVMDFYLRNGVLSPASEEGSKRTTSVP